MSIVIWSWPNQQVVREDQSGPGVDDNDPDPPLAGDENAEPQTVDEMTKAELLDLADEQGVTADRSMTKADIIAAIEEGPTAEA